MNNNLPRVYANPINKPLNNNLDYYVSNSTTSNDRTLKQENIPRRINEIFASPHHVYKSRVHIRTLDNMELDTVIVGKTSSYLLTLNGDKISINNIVNIDKI